MFLSVFWFIFANIINGLLTAAYTAFIQARAETGTTLQQNSNISITERAYISLQKNTSRVNISVGLLLFVFYLVAVFSVFNLLAYLDLSGLNLYVFSAAAAILSAIIIFFISVWFGSKYSAFAWKIGAIPLYIFYVLIFPVSQFIIWLRSHISGSKKMLHPAMLNIKTIMSTSLQSGDDIGDLNLPAADQEIYQNAMEFPSLRVRDCMIPRTEIVGVEIGDEMDIVKQHFINSGHSKLLVYKESIDNVIGYIHLIDMYRKPTDIQKIVMPITIATESMPASDLLKQLIEKRRSMAVVVDEFGGTGGMVTIEDLIEEIIGDIEDEYDVDDETEKKISDTEYIFSGRQEIEYLNEKYNLNLPEGDYDTLGGLIFYIYQNIPKPGEVIVLQPFEFTILSTENARILDIRVKLPEKKDEI